MYRHPMENDGQNVVRLDALVVSNPAATWFLQAHGESMADMSIHDGDILVVDRSRPAGAGNNVIIATEDGFQAERIARRPRKDVWGVVTRIVHEMQKTYESPIRDP